MINVKGHFSFRGKLAIPIKLLCRNKWIYKTANCGDD